MMGGELVLLVTPLETEKFAVPATVVFSVDFLWDLPGTALKHADVIETHGAAGAIAVYCTCAITADKPYAANGGGEIPVGGAYFAAPLTQPVGVSTGANGEVWHEIRRL